MNFFKKSCDKCKKIETIKHIKSTNEFFDILQEIKRLLAEGDYEYLGGNNPSQTIKLWSQDGLWYRIKCKRCGAAFTLWYNTFKGKGTFKKGK